MVQTHRLNKQQRQANDLLLALTETPIWEFLGDLYAEGFSYETIAKELYSATNGTVDVSYQTVKRWLTTFGVL